MTRNSPTIERLEAGETNHVRSDAEASLLGSVMIGLSESTLIDLVERIHVQDFWSIEHGEIWRTIQALAAQNRVPDLTTVREDLVKRKVKFDPVRLFDLAHNLPHVFDVNEYARQILDAAGGRRLQSAAIQVWEIGQAPGDLDERFEDARQAIDVATSGRTVSKARMIADVLPDVIDVAENGSGEMLSTGWPDIDRIIGGVAPGRLIVVGARPGVGKSLFGTNLALTVAHKHHHAVFLASLEMPEREVGQRLLACHAKVSLTGLQSGRVPEREWDQIARKQAEIEALPIAIDDAPGQTIASIRASVRNFQRQREDLAVIVVDYLQLVRSQERRSNRAEEVAEISRGLKVLARETGACVVAMAQLNREAAKGDAIPRLTDLRESGAIEADADQVILMHQPEQEIPELELLIDKNRHGARGRARLLVAGHYAHLGSISSY